MYYDDRSVTELRCGPSTASTPSDMWGCNTGLTWRDRDALLEGVRRIESNTGALPFYLWTVRAATPSWFAWSRAGGEELSLRVYWELISSPSSRHPKRGRGNRPNKSLFFFQNMTSLQDMSTREGGGGEMVQLQLPLMFLAISHCLMVWLLVVGYAGSGWSFGSFSLERSAINMKSEGWGGGGGN